MTGVLSQLRKLINLDSCVEALSHLFNSEKGSTEKGKYQTAHGMFTAVPWIYICGKKQCMIYKTDRMWSRYSMSKLHILVIRSAYFETECQYLGPTTAVKS